MLIEYKVRQVMRYIVTRFETTGPDEEGKGNSTSSQLGEYASPEIAHEVGYALCKAEHERLGWPVGDERILYPRKEWGRPVVDYDGLIGQSRTATETN